jgi:hypothetical protein
MSRGEMCQGRYLRSSLHMLVGIDGLFIVVHQSESFFDGQVKGDYELRLRTILYGRHGVEVVVADEGDNIVRPLDDGLIILFYLYFVNIKYMLILIFM